MVSDTGIGFKFHIHRDSLFVLQDDDEGRPLATAFCFLKPEWVVTAKHAVLDRGEPRQNLSLFGLRNNILRASVYFLHPSHDLAVLRIEGQSPCDVPMFPSFEEYTGQRGLVYCGFAPSLSYMSSRKHIIHVNRTVSYEREERNRQTGDESLIVFDAPEMEGGHSGGPVFGEGGGVTAVLIELIRSENGATRARATSIIHLLRFLTFGNS